MSEPELKLVLPDYAPTPLGQDEGSSALQPNEPDTSLLPGPVDNSSDELDLRLPSYAPPPVNPDAADATVMSRATADRDKNHEAMAKGLSSKTDFPSETLRSLDGTELKSMELGERLSRLHPSAKSVVKAMANDPYASIQFTDSIAQMEVVMRGISREEKAEQDAKAGAEFRGQSTWERQFKNPALFGTSIMMGGINLKSADSGFDILKRMRQIDAAEGNFTETQASTDNWVTPLISYCPDITETSHPVSNYGRW